ncbi:MAG: dTMP kinase [Candidatus Latescibacteria bacterium]|nr:dTMP kinase [Candidatus Latescibacterota bacterium]
MKGFLITFEGIDGSGKTTQAELLYKYLINQGYIVQLLREPGGTLIGERIRSILLDSSLTEMKPYTELFLYLAARVQICFQHISPALDRGEIVVMDRFFDSSTAYQGFARGLGSETVEYLNSIATGGIIPDVTFFIDCDPEIALARISAYPDRLESEGITFMSRVRDGFLKLCALHSTRFIRINGELSIPDMQALIVNEVLERFSIKL